MLVPENQSMHEDIFPDPNALKQLSTPQDQAEEGSSLEQLLPQAEILAPQARQYSLSQTTIVTSMESTEIDLLQSPSPERLSPLLHPTASFLGATPFLESSSKTPETLSPLQQQSEKLQDRHEKNFNPFHVFRPSLPSGTTSTQYLEPDFRALERVASSGPPSPSPSPPLPSSKTKANRKSKLTLRSKYDSPSSVSLSSSRAQTAVSYANLEDALNASTTNNTADDYFSEFTDQGRHPSHSVSRKTKRRLPDGVFPPSKRAKPKPSPAFIHQSGSTSVEFKQKQTANDSISEDNDVRHDLGVPNSPSKRREGQMGLVEAFNMRHVDMKRDQLVNAKRGLDNGFDNRSSGSGCGSMECKTKDRKLTSANESSDWVERIFAPPEVPVESCVARNLQEGLQEDPSQTEGVDNWSDRALLESHEVSYSSGHSSFATKESMAFGSSGKMPAPPSRPSLDQLVPMPTLKPKVQILAARCATQAHHLQSLPCTSCAERSLNSSSLKNFKFKKNSSGFKTDSTAENGHLTSFPPKAAPPSSSSSSSTQKNSYPQPGQCSREYQSLLQTKQPPNQGEASLLNICTSSEKALGKQKAPEVGAEINASGSWTALMHTQTPVPVSNSPTLAVGTTHKIGEGGHDEHDPLWDDSNWVLGKLRALQKRNPQKYNTIIKSLQQEHSNQAHNGDSPQSQRNGFIDNSCSVVPPQLGSPTGPWFTTESGEEAVFNVGPGLYPGPQSVSGCPDDLAAPTPMPDQSVGSLHSQGKHRLDVLPKAPKRHKPNPGTIVTSPVHERKFSALPSSQNSALNSRVEDIENSDSEDIALNDAPTHTQAALVPTATRIERRKTTSMTGHGGDVVELDSGSELQSDDEGSPKSRIPRLRPSRAHEEVDSSAALESDEHESASARPIRPKKAKGKEKKRQNGQTDWPKTSIPPRPGAASQRSARKAASHDSNQPLTDLCESVQVKTVTERKPRRGLKTNGKDKELELESELEDEDGTVIGSSQSKTVGKRRERREKAQRKKKVKPEAVTESETDTDVDADMKHEKKNAKLISSKRSDWPEGPTSQITVAVSARSDSRQSSGKIPTKVPPSLTIDTQISEPVVYWGAIYNRAGEEIAAAYVTSVENDEIIFARPTSPNSGFHQRSVHMN
ncbi:hypothetical protein GGU11DRAFT_743870 [Lentinula aff. detonsa]|nr:hypothetical protein GGU11DRAFT_743870 [Lentinula aff. detonsa]